VKEENLPQRQTGSINDTVLETDPQTQLKDPANDHQDQKTEV